MHTPHGALSHGSRVISSLTRLVLAVASYGASLKPNRPRHLLLADVARVVPRSARACIPVSRRTAVANFTTWRGNAPISSARTRRLASQRQLRGALIKLIPVIRTLRLPSGAYDERNAARFFMEGTRHFSLLPCNFFHNRGGGSSPSVTATERSRGTSVEL